MKNPMKYVVILGDGMADQPIGKLGGKTPLDYANTPAMDQLAAHSEIGMCRTIPRGMSPGSDTANLAVLGYNPKRYYTGRSPLEAISIGVKMHDNDVAVRCNLVTLSEEEGPYEERTMIDHSSGEITTEEADILIQAVKAEFESETIHFYTGTGYRHLLIWNQGNIDELTPPHDILTKKVKDYLPENQEFLNRIKRSYEILNHHPINLERAKRGLNKANSIWFWGAGTKPFLHSFEEKTGKRGAMISAVDLLKGIAKGAGMETIIVEGANGGLHTNYTGKAKKAVEALTKSGFDFVYIHVEAPDEMGHQGNLADKIEAIESLDQKVIRVVAEELDKNGVDYRLLIMPDHPTPIALRTHTADPVPYLLYDSRMHVEEGLRFTEEEAGRSKHQVEHGYQLIDKLLQI